MLYITIKEKDFEEFSKNPLVWYVKTVERSFNLTITSWNPVHDYLETKFSQSEIQSDYDNIIMIGEPEKAELVKEDKAETEVETEQKEAIKKVIERKFRIPIHIANDIVND